MPKAQPNQAAFWCWDYFLKTIFVQGPFLLRSSYQLNPTDFAIIKHSAIHFLILEKNFVWGLVNIYCYLTAFYCIFTSFRSDYLLVHLPFEYVGVPLSLVHLQVDYWDLIPTFFVPVCWTIWMLQTFSLNLYRRFLGLLSNRFRGYRLLLLLIFEQSVSSYGSPTFSWPRSSFMMSDFVLSLMIFGIFSF